MKITHKRKQLSINKRNTKTNKDLNICEFYEEGYEPKNSDTHIYSSSFFKLGNMYKDISIYIEGLERLVNYIDKLVTEDGQNIHFFLYYDNSVVNDTKFITIKSKCLSKPFIKLIKYRCPTFIDKKINMHKGLFGTFVRMFPLFNPKYYNNIKTVIDIDFDDNLLYILLEVVRKQILTNNNDIIALSRIGGEWAYTNLIKSKYFNGTIVANITFNRFSLNYDIITDNLNKINDGNEGLLEMFKTIVKNQYIPAFKDNKYAIDPHNLFIFGIEEYFLNNIVIDYCIKHNKKLGVVYQCDPSINLYVNSMIKWHNEDKKIVSQFFDEFLNKTKITSQHNIKALINEAIKNIMLDNVKSISDFKNKLSNLYKYYKLVLKYKNKLHINKDFLNNLHKIITYKDVILYSPIIKDNKIGLYIDKHVKIQDYIKHANTNVKK